jgi:hypothetical protein
MSNKEYHCAAEALYHSIGYAMNKYINCMKPEHKNEAWSYCSDLNCFNVYNIINKMKEYRETVNKYHSFDFIKYKFVEHTVPHAKESKDHKNLDDLQEITNILKCVMTACEEASNEFYSSIEEYAQRDEVKYNTLSKIEHALIENTINYFQDLSQEARRICNNMTDEMFNIQKNNIHKKFSIIQTRTHCS